MAAAGAMNGSGAAGPVFLDAAAVEALLPLPSLVQHLRSSLPLSSSIHTPLRHHHPLPSAPGSLLLLMPSWSTSPLLLPYLGVKTLTSFPSNPSPLPSLHSLYSLFHSTTGLPLASLDASPLTLLRTSALSSLASSLLSPPSPSLLLLIGSGALAPYLLRAHLLARPSLRRVLLWNRTPSRALSLLRSLSLDPSLHAVHFDLAHDLDDAVRAADVICCATGSTQPLVKGDLVKDGAHVDLVGSYTPEMRECDDELMRRGRVFVDCDAAVVEAGEVVGAVARGVMNRVEGLLVEVVRGEKVGRRSPGEITVFKSVGSGAVDLLAAQLVYENFMRMNGDSKQAKQTDS